METFEKMEHWEKPLWVLMFGLLNSLYAILALGMWLMIIVLTSVESIKVVDAVSLYSYFIMALFIIPASEFLSLQLKINRVVSLSLFSVGVLGIIVSTHFLKYNPTYFFVTMSITVAIILLIMFLIQKKK